MAATHLIAVRVTPELKAQFRLLADRQQVTESALLKRMISLSIETVSGTRTDLPKPPKRVVRDGRLCMRLRTEDQLLIQERAAARQMAAATYASVVVRAHLRSLQPLPKEELLALKSSVAELGAIGRNLNQIARAAHQGGRLPGPGRDDLLKMLKVCSALRDHVKALIKANIVSWEVGHAGSDE